MTSTGSSSPTQVDLRLIAAAGDRRDRALEEAEAYLEGIADELLRVEGNGGRVNVSLAARLAGVSRDTIYAAMSRRRSTENTHTNGRNATP